MADTSPLKPSMDKGKDSESVTAPIWDTDKRTLQEKGLDQTAKAI
jgi:hypothetical protein